MARLKLSPPWIEFYEKVNLLFEQDPSVSVVYDEDEMEIRLYVEDADVATALTYLLPSEKTFGNVVLKLTVIPANDQQIYAAGFKPNDADLIKVALKNNKAVSFIETVEGGLAFNATYVVFENCVVQYFDDNLSKYNGIVSMLYEDIARDVFDGLGGGIFFSTDIPSNNQPLGRPLGEWP